MLEVTETGARIGAVSARLCFGLCTVIVGHTSPGYVVGRVSCKAQMGSSDDGAVALPPIRSVRSHGTFACPSRLRFRGINIFIEVVL